MKLAKGTEIRIVCGPFAELVGSFQGMADDQRILVLLNLLGRLTKAKLPSDLLAPV